MTTLITGPNGFVGSHLVERLVERGESVRCLVRSTSRRRWLDGCDVEFVHGDVTDRGTLIDAVKGTTTIFHVAGVIQAADRADYQRVNALGTRNLLDAVAKACETPPRVVCVSSIAASGPATEGQPRDETDEPNPVNAYGFSKAAGEEAARVYSERIPITVVRPPIVYGPRDTAVLPVFRMAKLGLMFRPGIGSKWFSLVHVQDLADALVAAADKGRTLVRDHRGEGVYFAADEGPYSWDQMYHSAAAALSRRARIVPVPDAVTQTLSFFGELAMQLTGKPILLNRDRAAENAQIAWTCNAKKSREELGFKVRFEMTEGFAQTARWYRSQGWL